MDIEGILSDWNSEDFINKWNSPHVFREFFIYTPLTVEKLVSFFKNYRTDLVSIEKQEDETDLYYFNYHDPENRDYFLWGGIIEEPDNEFFDDEDFGFEENSVLYTDVIFSPDTNFYPDLLDKFFLELKRLRKGLNEEGIPHYVAISMVGPTGEERYSIIGGVNSNGEAVVHSESLNLVEANIFSKDEWFYKSKKKFNF